MDKKTLSKWYDDVVKTTGFQPTKEPPWIPPLSPGNFRELKQNGWWKDKAATLQIIPNESMPADVAWQRNLAESYNQLAITDAVRIPQVLAEGKSYSYIFLILERPEGGRIISDEGFRSAITHSNIGETVRVHWATVESLDLLVEANEAVRDAVLQWSPARYFIERFHKWETSCQELNPKRDDLITERDKERTLAKVFERVSSRSRLMAMSFNVFGNTDIIKTKTGQYYLVNGHFEAKPQGFAPAAWLWNLMLYGGRKSENELFNEVYTTIVSFSKKSPVIGYHDDIILNLTERTFAGLSIDLGFRRSPHEQEAGREYFQTVRNFRYILDQFLKP